MKTNLICAFRTILHFKFKYQFETPPHFLQQLGGSAKYPIPQRLKYWCSNWWAYSGPTINVVLEQHQQQTYFKRAKKYLKHMIMLYISFVHRDLKTRVDYVLWHNSLIEIETPSIPNPVFLTSSAMKNKSLILY